VALRASDTPELIKFTKQVHDELLRKHPELANKDFNTTLGYIRTLSLPDKVINDSSANRTNYVREVADKINKVGVKPTNPDGQAYINTSFLQGRKGRNKALLEGSADPSSHPLLPEGGGTEVKLSALKSKVSIPNDTPFVRKQLPTSSHRIKNPRKISREFGVSTPGSKTTAAKNYPLSNQSGAGDKISIPNGGRFVIGGVDRNTWLLEGPAKPSSSVDGGAVFPALKSNVSTPNDTPIVKKQLPLSLGEDQFF
jgi:hypothetical protein